MTYLSIDSAVAVRAVLSSLDLLEVGEWVVVRGGGWGGYYTCNP